MIRLKEIKKVVDDLGFVRSIGFYRKLDKAGVISTVRNKHSRYRELDDAMFEKSVRNVILYIFGVPKEDIIQDDSLTINYWVKRIKKALKLLK
jgi:hypothetical protein